jgi:hypothetical protein
MVVRTVRVAAQPELVRPMAVRLEPVRLEPELVPEHPTARLGQAPQPELVPGQMPGLELVPGHRPSNHARSQTRFDLPHS